MHYSESPQLRNDPEQPLCFNDKIANKIIDLIFETNLSLREICKKPDFPSRATLTRWRTKHPDFDAEVQRAQRERIEDMQIECVGIADTAYEGFTVTYTGEDGGERQQKIREDLSYVELRLRERHGLAAQLPPKKRPGDNVEDDVATLPVPNTLALPRPEDDPLIEATRDWNARGLAVVK
jgi:hypothetical protein